MLLATSGGEEAFEIPKCGHCSLGPEPNPLAQDPLLYLRTKLWPELVTAVEQEAATYVNISALGGAGL